MRICRTLLILLSVALVVRVGVLAVKWDSLSADPDGYKAIADNIRTTGTFGRSIQENVHPTAFRPPLYPVCLAVVSSLGSSRGIAGLHLLLGLVTVGMVFLIGKQVFPRRYAFVTGLFVASDPILLQQSTLAMTETLATFLVTLSWFLLTRSPSRARASSVGISLGLAALCRPTFLLLAASTLLWLFWQNRRLAAERRWSVGLVAVLLTLTCLPWVVRNQLQFGQLKLTTTHGGYTLWLGNNVGFYDYLRKSDWTSKVWNSAELDRESLTILKQAKFDEFAADREHYRRAFQTIRNEPGMFAFSCLIRVQRLWGVFPYQLQQYGSTGKRVMLFLVGAWYIGLFGLAIVGLIRRRAELLSSPWIFGLLLCVVMTAVHAIYWSNLRMRAPLMPFLALLATAGVARNLSSQADT